MTFPPAVFGLIGTGVIGSGWAVRALARGLDVVAWDPAPGAAVRLRDAIDRAWPSAQQLGLYAGARPDRVHFADSPETVCDLADFVQESAPEDERLKRDLLTRLDAAAPAEVVIASSSSGLLPTRIASGCSQPERVVIGHPFNPVYLLPLVEVVAGERTSTSAVERAAAVYDYLDMYPLVVRHEIPGYLSDRLQEALWREILHLVNDGIATTGELDDAIMYGPGLRWAGMGTNLTFHLAGGRGGMRHMLEQFGPALRLPWARTAAPELSDALIDTMVDGTADQAAGRSVENLERLRDDYLVATMRALRSVGVGAGDILTRREARRYGQEAATWSEDEEVPAPLELFRCDVEPDWVDYNNHVTEAAYLTAFGWATDALFRYIGDDEEYRAEGHSFYTVETHINYLREVSGNGSMRFATRVVGLDPKRLHLYHEMFDGSSGDLVAATEQMLLHMNTVTGRPVAIEGTPAHALAAIREAHRGLPAPEYLGRIMATKGGS
ncbi:MAG: L-carnitine dehydrogenase [bacterium]|nr:L-carnitine dehydrogenase [bacterium]MDE0439568.1 L-carnitine dehydrogenase [bacterium]